MRAVALVATASLLAGCSGDSGSDQDGSIEIEDAVVGATPEGADAALYFDIVGGAGDALVGASSPASEQASLHTLEPVEGGGIMYPTDRIDLEGDVTTLAPIDKHVMLEGLHDDLVDGDIVAVTLDFDDHPDIEIEAEVVPLADLAELLPEQE